MSVADRTGLDARLTEVAHQYDEVQAELAKPETSTDPDAIRRLGQELSRLEPVVEAFRRLEATRKELAGVREMRDASDSDALFASSHCRPRRMSLKYADALDVLPATSENTWTGTTPAPSATPCAGFVPARDPAAMPATCVP